MDGFTDCAFRQITKEIFDKYGEKDKYEFHLRTEFMNADGYMINPTGLIRHLMSTQEQAPVIAQIFSGDEKMLLKCFADIQKKYGDSGRLKVEGGKLKVESGKGKVEDGDLSNVNSPSSILHSQSIFSGLELNMGCPSRCVMNNGGGSGLLRERKRSLGIIKKLSGIMKMPFSVKTRTGLDDQDTAEQIKFLVEVSKYVSMITIHGRTVKQGYADNGNRDFIYELKSKVDKNCKVVGNGGIKSYEDLEKFAGNLDGVGIGQAAIGNPRIFTPHTPSREEIKSTILRHLDYMIAYENFFQEQIKRFDGVLSMPPSSHLLKPALGQPGSSEKSSAITIVEFRKHLFQYVKGIPESKEFKQKVATIREYEPLLEEIQKFFG